MLTTAKPIFSTLRAGLTAGILAVTLSACGTTNWGFPYRPDVQQGNWITSEQVAQLQPGMTRDQVRFVLGTPTLQDVFRTDRWDYPYYNKPGYGDEQERKFTVWFEGDSLVRWAGDEQPDRQPFEPADTGMSAERTERELQAEKRAVERAEEQSETQSQADEETAQSTERRATEPEALRIITTDEANPGVPGVPTPGRNTAEPLR